MSTTRQTTHWLLKPFSNDGGKLLLRLWLGSMMVYHGWGKVLGDSTKMVERITDWGWPAPEFFAWAAGFSEFGGGFLIILGLGTKPASLAVAITMFVAAFVAHGPDPFGKKELALTFCCMALVLFIIGPGRWSTDHMVFGGK